MAPRKRFVYQTVAFCFIWTFLIKCVSRFNSVKNLRPAPFSAAGFFLSVLPPVQPASRLSMRIVNGLETERGRLLPPAARTPLGEGRMRQSERPAARPPQ